MLEFTKLFEDVRGMGFALVAFEIAEELSHIGEHRFLEKWLLAGGLEWAGPWR